MYDFENEKGGLSDMKKKQHEPDCTCGHCILEAIGKKGTNKLSIAEEMKSQSIQPDDLMWHLDATERELGEYYTACANAMNRIRAIQSTVRLLLVEREKRAK